MRDVVRRHPLAAFFVLSYALSWWPVPFGAFLPFGPLLSALAVTSLINGRDGRRALVGQLFLWRGRARWCAVAVGIPLTVVLASAMINVGLGASASALRHLDPLYVLVGLFLIRLFNPLDGPMGEELGWRGFALPRLQRGRSPLTASIILGALVAVWHVPLIFLPGERLAPVLLIGTIAVTFFYTWLFNHARQSVFVTSLAHAAEGVITLGAFGYAAADDARLAGLYAAGWCLVALGIVAFDRTFRHAPGQYAGVVIERPMNPRPLTADPRYRGREPSHSK